MHSVSITGKGNMLFMMKQQSIYDMLAATNLLED